MIYRFKSKADGDLLMMSSAAETLLRIIGKEPAAQGIITAAALPAAMAAIEHAVGAEERAADELADEDEGRHAAERISLRQRAWPLLEMMRRSHAEGADIVWGV